jgi:hypothetical protein
MRSNHLYGLLLQPALRTGFVMRLPRRAYPQVRQSEGLKSSVTSELTKAGYSSVNAQRRRATAGRFLREFCKG